MKEAAVNNKSGLLALGAAAVLALFLLRTKPNSNPPDFAYEVTGISALPVTLYTGETVTITVGVRNTSSVAGTATVNLSGDFIGSKNVSLPAQLGATGEAVFEFTVTAPGVYAVSAGGYNASFECVSSPPTFSLLSSTSSPNPAATGSNETFTFVLKNNSSSQIHVIVYIGIRGADNTYGSHPEYNPGLTFAAGETKTVICVLQNYFYPGEEYPTIMVYDSTHTQTFIWTRGQTYTVV